MSKDERLPIPAGCFALFGVPFVAAGIFVLLLACRSWWLYFDSASWTSTAAEIVSVELKTKRSSNRSSYEVACRYRYLVAGKEYESTRIGVTDWGKGNAGADERRFRSLESARSRGSSWPALVDPSNPARAMLFREIDLSMYLMLLLGLLVGGAGAIYIVRVLRGSNRGSPDPPVST
jgi:hypothetical protein